MSVIILTPVPMLVITESVFLTKTEKKKLLCLKKYLKYGTTKEASVYQLPILKKSKYDHTVNYLIPVKNTSLSTQEYTAIPDVYVAFSWPFMSPQRKIAIVIVDYEISSFLALLYQNTEYVKPSSSFCNYWLDKECICLTVNRLQIAPTFYCFFKTEL